MTKEPAGKRRSLKLVAPWVEFYRKIEALFQEDPDVTVEYDEENPEVKLYVRDTVKADALSRLLPGEKSYGNIKLRIRVLPANGTVETMVGLVAEAFRGNPIFRGIYSVEGVFDNPIHYVQFEPVVAQYFSDSLHDPNGNRSTLYQDLACEVIGEEEGVFFCTAAKGA